MLATIWFLFQLHPDPNNGMARASPAPHFGPRRGAQEFLAHWFICERCNDLYEDPLQSLAQYGTGTNEEREFNERIYWRELAKVRNGGKDPKDRKDRPIRPNSKD